MVEDVGGIKGEAQLDVEQFQQGVRQLKAAINSLDGALKSTEANFNKVEGAASKAATATTGWGNSFKSLFPQLTAANLAATALYRAISELSRVAATAFTDPIRQAAQFQTTMANVASIIKGDPTQAMKTFNQAVLDMSRVIPKDPNDLGAGLYQVLSANITKPADALSVLTVSAKAAVGGLTDTKTSVDAITTVLNAYQMKASQAQAVSDSLFVAVRDGKITYEEMAQSLGLVISTAAQAQVPLDEMNAAIVALTLAGQQSSHAATDLNTFIDSVIKASKGSNDASKMAKQLGIEYDTTALHAMGLAKFIQQVADKAGNNDVALQTLTGDVRGFRAIAVLAGQGLGNFNMALDDMKEKAGTADIAFQRNSDTLQNDWTLAMNSLNSILIDAGQQQLPAMQQAVDDLSQAIDDNRGKIEDAASALSVELVGGIQEVIKEAPDIINALSEIAKAAGVVAKAIVAVINAETTIGHGIGSIELHGMALVGNKSAQAALALQDLGPQLFDQERAMQFVPDNRNYTPAVNYSRGVPVSASSSTDVPKTATGGGVGGAGGAGSQKEENQALSDAKKILQDMQSVEKDIISSYGDEAKANKTRVDALRDALELKKQMGTITSQEQTQLDRINDLVDYQKEKIADATQAWRDQQKTVEDLQKKIADIKDQIQKAGDDLQNTLVGIDKDAEQQKADIVAKLLKEKADLENHNGPLTGDQSYRLGQINSELQGADATTLAQGQQLSQMTDLQRVDYDAQQKRLAAAKDNNAQLDELTGQLAQAQVDLGMAQETLKKRIDDVTAAQTQQQTTLTDSYKVIEKETQAHVNSQIAQLDAEKAHVDALAASYANVASYIADPLNLGAGSSTKQTNSLSGFADGGFITGPGTGTSDSIIARLSNGEYVMPAAATAAYRPILDAMRSMSFALPRFAAGGPVSSSVNNSRSVTINNYGEAARVMSRPDLLRWNARFANR